MADTLVAPICEAEAGLPVQARREDLGPARSHGAARPTPDPHLRLAAARADADLALAALESASPAAASPTAQAAAVKAGGDPSLQRGRRPVRPLRIAGVFVTTLLAVVVGLVAAGNLLRTWGLLPVLTGSMRPGIQPGDLVLVTPEPTADVKPGQILAFQPPGLGGTTVVHRVISVAAAGGAPVIRTKGDANNVPDAWKARLNGTTAWRVRAVIPKFGYLAVAEQNPLFRLILKIGLIAGGLGVALGAIWRHQRDEDSDEQASESLPAR
jgi:signal peptidase I